MHLDGLAYPELLEGKWLLVTDTSAPPEEEV
jgi:hypothetical protein